MSKREGYGKRMERNLTQFGARIDARKANGDATAEQLAAWSAAGSAARTKLDELQAAAARYAAMRDELDAAWDAMAKSLGDVETPPIAAVS